MNTTLREIYTHNPCKEGFARLNFTLTGNQCFNSNKPSTMTKHFFELNITKQFALLPEDIKDKEISMLQILESNGIKDAIWALRTQPIQQTSQIREELLKQTLTATIACERTSLPPEKYSYLLYLLERDLFIFSEKVCEEERISWEEIENILRKHL